MTDKVTLTDLANLQNESTAVTAINNNNAAITTAMDNTLSRDGTSPNQMGAVLDMNGFQILNLPQPTTNNSALRFQDLADFQGGNLTLNSLPTGGTVGQVLKKNSSTNYDASFASIAGDITGQITATNVAKIQGTTVSGTTGSGNVVLSASPTLTGTTTLATATITSAGITTMSGNPNFTGTPTLASETISGKGTYSATGVPVHFNGSTTANRPGSPAEGDIRYNTTLHALEWYNGTSWIVQGQATTINKPATGSGTYTPSTGVVRIRVRMLGGGGGGGAQVTNAGTTGNNSSFQPSGGSTWTAVGGSGGSATASNLGGAGGTGGTDGTGTLVVRIQGGRGGTNSGSTASNFGGGTALSPTTSVSVSGSTGLFGATNSGAGGSGGWTSAAAAGSGGGGGEYVEFLLTAAQLNGSATYTVAAAANGGAAGTVAGGNGASGLIIIEEFYA